MILRIMLLGAMFLSAQPYDIVVGGEETFLVLGSSVSIHADVGDVAIVRDEMLAPDAHAVTLHCASSPTGRCTGTIGPG